MKIIRSRVIIPKGELDRKKIIKNLERYARICYKSEDKITENSAENFIAGVIKRGHESVIEHEKVTVIMIVGRDLTHEIVRHRIASYSQESTRYVNYSNEKYNSEITVIEPFFYKNNNYLYNSWLKSCKVAETEYMNQINNHAKPQEARSVLPNCTKTEIAITFNMREWRHFFRLRCSSAAHPQMRQVTIPLLLHFKKEIPILFDDISYDESFNPEDYADIIQED